MSLISATHYTYSYGDGFSAGETRTFGTLRSAQLWAATVVPDVVTTNDCYWRDMARAEHVEFTRIYRGKRPSNRGRFWRKSYAPAGRYDAKAVIVPSVGELGYW